MRAKIIYYNFDMKLNNKIIYKTQLINAANWAEARLKAIKKAPKIYSKI